MFALEQALLPPSPIPDQRHHASSGIELSGERPYIRVLVRGRGDAPVGAPSPNTNT